MTRIKLTTKLNKHKANDVINVTKQSADMLITNGHAVPVKTKTTPKGREGKATLTKAEGGGTSPDQPAQTAG